MLCWSLGSLYTSRAAKYYGSSRTNRWRLTLASVLLGTWIIAAGSMPSDPTLWSWLIFSGVIGLGVGDLFMMAGYRLVGAKISALLLLCLSTPIAGVMEGWIYGNALRSEQLILVTTILAGVALVVWPTKRSGPIVWAGIAAGLMGALGQGVSTVVSRIAYAEAGNVEIDGISAAWIRILGGTAFMMLIGLFSGIYPGRNPVESSGAAVDPNPGPFSSPPMALILSTLLGPVIGLSAFQWALVDHPSAIVQGIVSLSPVAMIPLAWWIDGEKPRWLEVIGGILACSGAGLLCALG